MAAVTADQLANQQHIPGGDGFHMNYEVAASTVIYKNTFVSLNATGYLTSYVAPAASAATRTGTRFVGIARESVASQTSDGDATCLVQTSGYFQSALTSAVIADIGKPVFLSDNATLIKSGQTGAFVGWIRGLESAGNVIVELPQLGQYGGHITRVSPIIDLLTLNDIVLLVHESENHNGLLLYSASMYLTTANVQGTAQAVVTIVHTASTSMGCTITAQAADAQYDILLGAGGQMVNEATGGAIVVAPADKAVLAKVTTAGTDAGTATGAGIVVAKFIAI
jgi:hypothetical protein